MRKYKILLVVRHPVGGIRTFFKYVYPTFDVNRYAFTLIAPSGPETTMLLADTRSLDIRYLSLAERATSGELFRCVSRTLASQSFDLVHSHGLSAATSSVLGALLTRTPHLLTLHDVFNRKQFLGSTGRVKRLAIARVLSLIDLIHCVSNDARENLLEYMPLRRGNKRRIRVIPNGVATEPILRAPIRHLRAELNLGQDCFLIGFLGRFMAQKGFRYLIDAMEGMLRQSAGARVPYVVTFGEGGYIREERAEVERRGLEGYVRFMPFVADVASTLKGLDVIAVPSLWEACPLLPMEALVAGIPVVGSDCLGLREVLRDTPAVMVPAANSQALARALRFELGHPSRAEAALFAPTAASRFDVRHRAAELEDMMLTLMMGSR